MRPNPSTPGRAVPALAPARAVLVLASARAALGCASSLAVPAFALALAAALPVSAQVPAAGRLLRLDASARAAGRGGAWDFAPRGRVDPDAFLRQPAALAYGSGVSAGLASLGGGNSALALAVVRSLGSGRVAMSLQALSSTSSAVAATVAYARTFHGLAFGGAVKLVDERTRDNHAAVAAVDLGLARDLGPVTIALSAANLGPGLHLAGGTGRLPRDVALGIASRTEEVGPLDVLAAGSLTRRRDGEWVPAAGLEIAYWPVTGRTFTLRFGARRVPEGDRRAFTAGLGFTADSISIDYAFEPGRGAGDGHRFGLRW